MSTFMRAGAKKDIHTKALGMAELQTPLHLAALGGHVAATKVLMMAGADVNVLDAVGDRPLHLAIRGGHAAVAEILLLRGANPKVEGSDGELPFHRAARHGQDEVVRTMLHAGVKADRYIVDGWTALGDAVRHGHLATVKVLLDGGADTTIRCFGLTPLHMAAGGNNAEMVAALVQAGTDLEVRDGRGRTPLHRSALYGLDTAILALLRLGVDVHAQTSNSGATTLHLACQEGELDTADLLLRWGADETTLDDYRDTPRARIPNVAKAAGVCSAGQGLASPRHVSYVPCPPRQAATGSRDSRRFGSERACAPESPCQEG